MLGELEEGRFRELLGRAQARRREIAQKLADLPQGCGPDLTALRAELERSLDRVLSAPEEDAALLFALVEDVEVGKREGDGTIPVTVKVTSRTAGWSERLERSAPMNHSIWKVI